MKRCTRCLIYFAGMVSLALGIILNAKTGLGISPLVSIAYCIAELNGFNFANTCMVMYTVVFLLEMLVKWKNAKLYDILQLPFCFVFTRIMNVFSAQLPDVENVAAKYLVMAAAILFTGLGIVLMVNMRLVPNPSDGLVQAISDRWSRPIGLCKNIMDAVCVLITITVSLLAAHRLIGVGVGTVASVLLIGRAVALFTWLFGKRLKRVYEEAVAAH